MVEEAANNYVNYLRQIDFSKEIDPISANIDEIVTRMDEFESTILIMKNIAAATSIPNIVECKNGFQQYSDKIDKITLMLDRINGHLTELEQNVSKAEEELGFNNTGIKGFFKPLLERVVKNDRSRGEHSEDVVPVYQPASMFRASDYFDTNCDRPTDLDAMESDEKNEKQDQI